MKIEKQNLRENIEQLIGEGVINGEEIDVTTDKVLKLVWILIDYLQTQGKNNVALADVSHQRELLKAFLDWQQNKYPMPYDTDIEEQINAFEAFNCA